VHVTKTVSETAAITTTMAATYTYDGYGRRARKEVAYPHAITPTQVITYLYDGLDIIGAQIAVSETVTESYYYLAQSPVTGMRRPFALERLPNPATAFPGDTHWYQTDGLDSVVALTDAAGNITSPYLYDEYGNQVISYTDYQLLTYTFQDYDQETDFYHFYARYYAPRSGSWLTLDSYQGKASVPHSLHRYNYARVNPVNRVDIYGYFDNGLCGVSVSCPMTPKSGCRVNQTCNLSVTPHQNQSTTSHTDIFAPYPMSVDRYASFQGINFSPNLRSPKPRDLAKNCAQLEADIQKTMMELQKRYYDLIKNKHTLPPTGPMSIAGHVTQYVGKQLYLQSLLAAWRANGCGGGGVNGKFHWDWAVEWAYKPSPVQVQQPQLRNLPEIQLPEVELPDVNTEVEPEDVATVGTVGIVGVTAYILWNSKGCLAGPWGCLIDWATPAI
jgi:RHS repeat-associated protein